MQNSIPANDVIDLRFIESKIVRHPFENCRFIGFSSFDRCYICQFIEEKIIENKNKNIDHSQTKKPFIDGGVEFQRMEINMGIRFSILVSCQENVNGQYE